MKAWENGMIEPPTAFFKGRAMASGKSCLSSRWCSFKSMRSCLFFLGFVAVVYLFGAISGQNIGSLSAARPSMRMPAGPMPDGERTKIAEGDYRVYEQANGGAVGPFEQEVYNFKESWTLWRAAKGDYHVEGVRTFDSPEYETHTNPFVVELSRDLTILSVTEFARLRWVPNSGPLSCEFLPADLHCSSGGSDPRKRIELRTHLTDPFGLLWPVSPFSLTGIARQVERDADRPTQVDLVTIEQPSPVHPVESSVLTGPLWYLGKEDIDTGGRKWHADKFSIKVPFHPEFLLWTSPRGLLLALAVQHEHKNWPDEGLRLSRFDGPADF
jgi:hypothetical protein